MLRRLLGDVSILVSGTLIAQVLAIAAQPLIKSLYGPEFFGAFEVYVRVASILVVFFSLRYEYALVSTPTESGARILFQTILIYAFVVFIFITILSNVFFQEVADLLNLQAAHEFMLFMIPVGALMIALLRVLTFSLTRSKKYKEMSLSKVVRRGIEAATQIGVGASGMGAGLILGEIAGNLSAVLYSVGAGKSWRLLKNKFSFREAKKLLVRYSDIPKFKLIPDSINVLSESILVFLVLREFGYLEVGLLELASKVLVVPIALLGTNVGPIILQRTSAAFSANESIVYQLKAIFLLLLGTATAFVVLLLTIGEPIFNMFFGESWNDAYGYISILTFYCAVQLVVSPFGETLVVLGKIKLDGAWKLFKFVALSFLFVLHFDSMESLLTTFSVIYSLCYFGYAILIAYCLISYEASIKTL